eukprot:snap_masked-scaffold_39-processed-gene-2.66-mRNA-1 protein AED:1.00 eAED:1.00 QI:0/-1/0/0/-1/1/1/0/376
MGRDKLYPSVSRREDSIFISLTPKSDSTTTLDKFCALEISKTSFRLKITTIVFRKLLTLNDIFEKVRLLLLSVKNLKHIKFDQCKLDSGSIKLLFSILRAVKSELEFTISERKTYTETLNTLLKETLSFKKCSGLFFDFLLKDENILRSVRSSYFDRVCTIKKIILDSTLFQSSLGGKQKLEKTTKLFSNTSAFFLMFFKQLNPNISESKYSNLTDLRVYNADPSSKRQVALISKINSTNLMNTLSYFLFDSVEKSTGTWFQVAKFISYCSKLKEVHIGNISCRIPRKRNQHNTTRPIHRSLMTHIPEKELNILLEAIEKSKVHRGSVSFIQEHEFGTLNVNARKYFPSLKISGWKNEVWDSFMNLLFKAQIVIYK